MPKVVFIVGPAGAATNGYRSQARAAAAIARKYTPDVIELYSPNATWPAVREALQGASLVVYMGHGNGWPSKYRDALYPPTQNGFGLNPKAGTGDYTHQYFGEASVGGQVKLAKNAIVLLNHLCYASGNTEPGLPEGNLDQAKQRVDNYAAGFIQAGASAVIAEAWSSPSYFVKTILSSNRSIQSAWSNAPSANRHRLAFKSERSDGYVAQMDTETATSGFTRSVVMKTGLALAGRPRRRGGFGARRRLHAAPARIAHPARADPDRDRSSSWARRTSSGCRRPGPRATSTSRSRSRIGRHSRRASRRASVGIRSTSRSRPQTRPTRSAAPLPGRAGGSGRGRRVRDTGPRRHDRARRGTCGRGFGRAGTGEGPQDRGQDGARGQAEATADTARARRRPSRGVASAEPAASAEAAAPAASPEASPDASPEASPSGSAAPEPDGPSVALPVDGGPADDEAGVLGAPQVDEPDVTPRLEIPAEELDLVVPGARRRRRRAGRREVRQEGDVGPGDDADRARQVPADDHAPRRRRRRLRRGDPGTHPVAHRPGHRRLRRRDPRHADGRAGRGQRRRARRSCHQPRPDGLGPRSDPDGLQRSSAAAPRHRAPTSSGAGSRCRPAPRSRPIPTAQVVRTELPVGLQPGVKVDTVLDLVAPTAPGQYLLMLDIVTPERGSLVAAGADPTLIRVTVLPAD